MLRHKREKFLVRIFLPSELRYWLHRNTFLWRIDKRLFSVSRTESYFKMKLSPAVTPRTRLRFLAVSVMFCAIFWFTFLHLKKNWRENCEKKMAYLKVLKLVKNNQSCTVIEERWKITRPPTCRTLQTGWKILKKGMILTRRFAVSFRVLHFLSHGQCSMSVTCHYSKLKLPLKWCIY